MWNDDLLSALPPGVTPVWAEYKGIRWFMLHPAGPDDDWPRDPGGPTPIIENPSRFSIWVSTRFGPAGSEKYNLFECRVTSVQSMAAWFGTLELQEGSGLLQHPQEPTVMSRWWLMPTIVMQEWSLPGFETLMRNLAEYVGPGPDWPAVASRLAQWMVLEDGDRLDYLINEQGPRPQLRARWFREQAD